MNMNTSFYKGHSHDHLISGLWYLVSNLIYIAFMYEILKAAYLVTYN